MHALLLVSLRLCIVCAATPVIFMAAPDLRTQNTCEDEMIERQVLLIMFWPLNLSQARLQSTRFNLHGSMLCWRHGSCV